MKAFDNWKSAHTAAIALARLTNHNVNLAKKHEFGKTIFTISLTCINDAQSCEIVKPSDAN